MVCPPEAFVMLMGHDGVCLPRRIHVRYAASSWWKNVFVAMKGQALGLSASNGGHVCAWRSCCKESFVSCSVCITNKQLRCGKALVAFKVWYRLCKTALPGLPVKQRPRDWASSHVHAVYCLPRQNGPRDLGSVTWSDSIISELWYGVHMHVSKFGQIWLCLMVGKAWWFPSVCRGSSYSCYSWVIIRLTGSLCVCRCAFYWEDMYCMVLPVIHGVLCWPQRMLERWWLCCRISAVLY